MGKELQAAGHVVDVAEMGSVTSGADYIAVTIGGLMYMGKMVGDTGKFVGPHYVGLEKLPVAGCIICFAPVSKDPDTDIENAQKAHHASLSPIESGCGDRICGKPDPAKLSWLQR